MAYPEDHWNPDGSDADYLNAIYVTIQARDFYITMQDNIYLCGIGDASFAAHQAAKRMASEWSGLMTFGELNGNLTQDAPILHGEESQGEVELKIMGTRAQLPVWMRISERNSRENCSAIAYWKEQNHVTGIALSGGGADEIWAPTPVRVRSEVNEEYIAQVRVAVGTEDFSVKHIEQAWEYIGLARRHRGQGRKCLRYFKDPIACGAVKWEKKVDGIMRTWYEYVPSSCTPDKTWPLVFVFHGRGGTAETFFDLSGISALAEERQFIAVIPQAGIYQQKEHGLRNVLVWCGEYQGKSIDDVKFIREDLCRYPDPLWHRPESCLCHGTVQRRDDERCAWLCSRRYFYCSGAMVCFAFKRYHENELSAGQPDRSDNVDLRRPGFFMCFASGRSGIAVFTGTKYAHCIHGKD